MEREKREGQEYGRKEIWEKVKIQGEIMRKERKLWEGSND